MLINCTIMVIELEGTSCYLLSPLQFFPEDGIKIFGNFLHSHLAGKHVEL